MLVICILDCFFRGHQMHQPRLRNSTINMNLSFRRLRKLYLRYLPQGLQLVCQLCQFTAASWDGLKLHASSEKHINQFALYQVIMIYSSDFSMVYHNYHSAGHFCYATFLQSITRKNQIRILESKYILNIYQESLRKWLLVDKQH